MNFGGHPALYWNFYSCYREDFPAPKKGNDPGWVIF